MKLIYCKQCDDVFKLDLIEKQCKCKESSGRRTRDEKFLYYGPYAVPISINDSSLKHACNNRPLFGFGNKFESFVIPINSSLIRKKI